jgi:hypothetical protein
MLKTFLIAVGLTLSGFVYAACKTVIIDSPSGSKVCIICNDGKYTNCSPL